MNRDVFELLLIGAAGAFLGIMLAVASNWALIMIAAGWTS